MILVIADDLTGAAEIAGEAFAFGLSVEVFSGTAQESNAEVVVIDTDSRSKTQQEAALALEQAGRTGLALNPDWVFKKVDSILRGHVAHETTTLLQVFGGEQAVVLPANPSKGRLVVEGQYLIHGIPLHQTPLADDPEYPRTTSSVELLLETDAWRPGWLSPGSAPVLPGLHTADITCEDDLLQFARILHRSVLAVGALDFFRALLQVRGTRKHFTNQAPHPAPTLFVCGSAAAWRSGRADEASLHGIPVFRMPDSLLTSGVEQQAHAAWSKEILEQLSISGCALIAIGQDDLVVDVRPGILATRLTETAAQLVESGVVFRVCVEGGGTATALMRRMGWSRYRVSFHWADGVISLRPFETDDIEIVVKVGSYAWPNEVWEGAVDWR